MQENISYQNIIDKAEELATILKSNPLTIRYQNALNLIKNDEKAQAIYERLVKIGKTIADVKDTGETLGDEFIEENESLGVELTQSPIVMEFVEAQKDYFEMMALVHKKISINS